MANKSTSSPEREPGPSRESTLRTPQIVGLSGISGTGERTFGGARETAGDLGADVFDMHRDSRPRVEPAKSRRPAVAR